MLFIALYGKPLAELRIGASTAIWDHTVLAATRYRKMRLTLTPAKKPVSTWLSLHTKEGWKAELTLVLVIYQYDLPVHRQLHIQVVG